jgi:hypothetical protein
MHRYLLAYLGFVDDIILSENPDDIDAILEEHLRQTDFMKHERLIHLIVTVLFAILLFICIGILAVTDKIIFALLTVMILCLLIPYISHYYFLENSVQKMYRQYNTMCSMTGRRKLPDECLLTKNTAGRGKKK